MKTWLGLLGGIVAGVLFSDYCCAKHSGHEVAGVFQDADETGLEFVDAAEDQGLMLK